MSPPRVRRLLPDEWAVYRDVRLAALSDSPEAFGSTLVVEQARSEAEWRQRLATHPQFVVSLEDDIVGTIGVIRSHEDAKVAEIVSMWVTASRRGLGIGDRLVQAAIDSARDDGYRDAHLWVSAGNDHAEGLYARHGFARTGAVQPIRPDEPERLEFAMARPLRA